MRKVILLLGLMSLCLTSIHAQNYEDVVYLKNGSIIRGLIIEQIPNQSVKIQTKDRNVFVYNIVDIEKLAKEPIKGDSGDLKPGTAFAWSLLFSGGGQFYNHQPVKGSIMMGLEVLGWVGYIVGLDQYTEYSYGSGYDEEWDPTLSIVSLILIGANELWSLIDAPVSASAINSRNGLSLNFNLNKNIHFALKPDYKIGNFNGKYNPVFGAKLSFSFH